MLHADPTLDYAAHDAAQQRRQDAYDEAHAGLMQEVIEALTGSDTYRSVRAPAFYGFGGQPLTSVLADYLAADSNDEKLRKLLSLISGCAHSTDPRVRLPALAMIGTCAKEHADMHAPEAV